ncbi:hypothetical protein [Streptococcus pluranimalium]|uniref:hypothetical protein n=1 Tax=Streptococcus pluranimalium TaxID=82348 RepID=UPI003F68BC75
MGLKSSLVTTVTAFITYKVFKKRQAIKATYETEKERLGAIQKDKEKIQHQVAIIRDEIAKIDKLRQDTEYKVRVFQKELEPRVSIIKDKTEHMQSILSSNHHNQQEK